MKHRPTAKAYTANNIRQGHLDWLKTSGLEPVVDADGKSVRVRS